jgi:hypothetical protein
VWYRESICPLRVNLPPAAVPQHHCRAFNLPLPFGSYSTSYCKTIVSDTNLKVTDDIESIYLHPYYNIPKVAEDICYRQEGRVLSLGQIRVTPTPPLVENMV